MTIPVVAVTQAHRLVRLALVGTVVATAVVHHVVGAVAQGLAVGGPVETDSMVGAFDRLSDGEPPEYLNSRL